MSVIVPPRIYFQGFMEWDPNTCNNNKWLLQWDVDTSELNWKLLKENGIDRTNFRTEFPKWASKMFPTGEYPCQPPCTTPNEQPALWDFFGGNGCDFVNNKKASTKITGGVLPSGRNQFPDALIETPISLKGNPFNGHPTQARLIDLDAASTMTSQIWFDSLQLGDDSAPILTGQRLDIMHSRLLNFSRNLGYHEQAGSGGCVWQCTIPNSNLQFDSDMLRLSPLLKALADGADNAQGIMLRFCTYLTLYYKNGIYNDIKIQPRTATEIEQKYKKVFDGELPIFSNPAYSRTVGSIGVWHADDMQNAPAERTLFANGALPYVKKRTAPTTGQAEAESDVQIHRMHTMSIIAKQLTVELGPVLCAFSYDQNGNTSMAHLDLGSTFPEIDETNPQTPTKYDFGSFELSVKNGNLYSVLAQIDYSDYEENTYIENAGMLDIATQPVSQSLVESGELVLRQLSGSKSNPACAEQVNRIQTDSRGVYLDQGETSDPITIRFQIKGKPAPLQKLTVVRYVADPDIQHTAECDLSQPMGPLTVTDRQTIKFAACTPVVSKPVESSTDETRADVAVLTTDQEGNAEVSVSAGVPGYTYLAFFAGEITSVKGAYSVSDVLYGEYAVVRVMPFDAGIQQEFVDVWNGVGLTPKHDPDRVWEFIYNRILYFYDMIYPVMQRYVPLGDKSRMEGAVDQLQVTLSDAYMQNFSTMMMPITRDLSSGKRWVLLTWCDLVKSNYQPIDLPPYSEPHA